MMIVPTVPDLDYEKFERLIVADTTEAIDIPIKDVMCALPPGFSFARWCGERYKKRPTTHSYGYIAHGYLLQELKEKEKQK